VAEFFEAVSQVAVLVFVVACMGAAGLGLGVREVVAPLRPRLVLLALAVNFVAAPAVAYGLAELVRLERAHAVGLFLLAGAAGAPFLPKLAELARGDLAFSVGLMLLLMVASVAFMPVALPLLIPGLAAEPWPLLRPLLFTMLLPLAAGMAVRARSERWAARLRPAIALVSNVSMVLAVALLVALNFTAMLGTFGSGAVAVAVVFVALSTALGYALGGPAAGTRSVLALGTGQRNVAAALLVATQNFPGEPGVVVMLIVSTLAGLVVLVLAARWCARRAAETSGESGAGALASAPVGVVAEERKP
jgi:BASS family bile acid:Na+ symporter